MWSCPCPVPVLSLTSSTAWNLPFAFERSVFSIVKRDRELEPSQKSISGLKNNGKSKTWDSKFSSSLETQSWNRGRKERGKREERREGRRGREKKGGRGREEGKEGGRDTGGGKQGGREEGGEDPENRQGTGRNTHPWETW